MKRIYSQPLTEITVLNLKNSTLDVHAGDTSFRADGEGGANTFEFEDNGELEQELAQPKSLWD